MSKFALEKIEQVVGKIKFYRLVIDSKCQFTEFCNSIENEGGYDDQLDAIYSRMNSIANLKMLPKEKFRQLFASPVKQYEIKTKDLRVYLIKEEKTGNIIFLGGKKNSQKGDIKKFITIVKSYHKYLNEK
jgi:hypothetical protein